MTNILAGILVFWLLVLVVAPETTGEAARGIAVKFMKGWNQATP